MNNPSMSTGISITTSEGFIACIVDVTPPNITREVQETGCMSDTGAMPKIPNILYDGGELGLVVQLDPEVTPPILLHPPVIEDVTVTFPNGLGEWTFKATMTQYAPSADFETVMKADVTYTVCDDITISSTS